MSIAGEQAGGIKERWLRFLSPFFCWNTVDASTEHGGWNRHWLEICKAPTGWGRIINNVFPETEGCTSV